MRHKERIEPLLDELKKFWMQNPDFRLSQLILHLSKVNGISEFYDVEDDQILNELIKLNTSVRLK